MKRVTRPVLLAMALGLSPALASESERPDHFRGEPAATLEEAFENLVTYNRKLERLLDSKLTLQTMAEVHQITYTLENALQKINSEVDDLAETLEALHLASEHGKVGVTQKQGKDYLGVAKKITK